MDKNYHTISISWSSLIRIVVVVFIVYLVWQISGIILALLAAVVIASAMEPGIIWFAQYKIPRVLAVIFIYMIVGFIIFSLVYAIIPALSLEAAQVSDKLPLIKESIEAKFVEHPVFGPLVEQGSAFFQDADTLKDSAGVIFDKLVGGTQSIISAFLTFLLITILAFYFSVQEKNIRSFISIVTPIEQRGYILELWQRSRHKIGQWIKGQLVLGFVIGVLVFMGLLVLGIEHAFLFAVLAAVFELVPVFGPIIAAIPPVLVGFSDGGSSLGIATIIFFVVIQQLENNLIIPMVITKVVGVPSILVILSIIIGSIIAGFLGVLLAIPVAVVLQELVTDLKLGRIGYTSH